MSDVIDWGKKIIDFFANIKTLFVDFIDFLPNELIGLLIPTLLLICGLFVYRFLR